MCFPWERWSDHSMILPLLLLVVLLLSGSPDLKLRALPLSTVDPSKDIPDTTSHCSVVPSSTSRSP